MRGAPPQMRGTNQSVMRDRNERLVLTLLRREGALASADISRRTGLSAQTSSVILRKLEQDGLLARGTPQRGKVGKPLMPLTLAPEGVLSFGLKLGRRSADLVLMNFVGEVMAHARTTYAFPTPAQVLAFLTEHHAAMLAALSPAQRARVAGLGIAAPFEMWNWLETVQASPADMQAWRDCDLAAEAEAALGGPVVLSNDATAACAAEHAFGRGREVSDWAYFFVGYFIGGGVVLNGAVYPGRSGNAGAFGSLPVEGRQLLHRASLYRLEERLVAAGLDPLRLWREGSAGWEGIEPQLAPWIDEAAQALARGAVAVCAVIDFGAVLIDGGFPPEVRDRLIAATEAALDGVDLQGITRPRLLAASVGPDARSIGAAILPVTAGFLLGA